MKELIKNKKFKLLSIFIMISLIITGLVYTVNAYRLIDVARIARENTEEFFKIPVQDLLNAEWSNEMNYIGDGDNMKCVQHWVKSPIYRNNWQKVSKVVDINFDGANTVSINGQKQNITDKKTLQYFNALAYATSHATTAGDMYTNPWKNTIAALSDSATLNPYLQLDGEFGEDFWRI